MYSCCWNISCSSGSLHLRHNRISLKSWHSSLFSSCCCQLTMWSGDREMWDIMISGQQIKLYKMSTKREIKCTEACINCSCSPFQLSLPALGKPSEFSRGIACLVSLGLICGYFGHKCNTPLGSWMTPRAGYRPETKFVHHQIWGGYGKSVQLSVFWLVVVMLLSVAERQFWWRQQQAPQVLPLWMLQAMSLRQRYAVSKWSVRVD